MKGIKNTRKGGFTIIETLVYLAIAGVLFLITVFYLGGKQRVTQFQQGMRDAETTFNDIANDTSTGLFPAFNDIRCEVQINSITFRSLTTTEIDPNDPVLPGENNECIFVGNIIQLLQDDPSGAAGTYYTHTLVGQNNIALGSNNFASTVPRTLFEPGVVDGTQTYQIPWGITITRAYTRDTTTNTIEDINGLAYLYSNFGDSLASGSSIKTGVASVSLYVREGDDKRTLTQYRNDLNYEINPNTEILKPLGSKLVHVCFDDNDGRQAMIEIGGESGSFIARTNFNPSAECTS